MEIYAFWTKNETQWGTNRETLYDNQQQILLMRFIIDKLWKTIYEGLICGVCSVYYYFLP
jgi:hypothetical protein